MNLDHVRQLTFAPIAATIRHSRQRALRAQSRHGRTIPLDEDELPYVYEGRGPLAVPSQCVTLCWPPFWHKEPETGISWRRILHGEQSFSLFRPLAGRRRGASRALNSCGGRQGRRAGGVVYTAHDLFDELTGEPLAHLRSAEFLRDDGGCGGFGAAPKLTRPLEDAGEPTAFCDFRTSTQAALLYRQASRDYMPIHADPDIAREAGFRSADLAWPQHFRPRLPGGPQALRAAKAGGDRLDGCALRVARVPRRHDPGRDVRGARAAADSAPARSSARFWF